MKPAKSPLVIWVWEPALSDWTDGIVIAIARSERGARKAVEKASPWAAKDIANMKPERIASMPRKARVFVVAGGS
jgi:hypothetical protein